MGIAAAEVPTMKGIRSRPGAEAISSASRAAIIASRVPRSMREHSLPPASAASGATPAVFTRWRDTSKKSTGENAERPVRKPSAFSATPVPIGETIPIPVTTTRRGGEGGSLCGGQAKGGAGELRLVSGLPGS